MAANKVKVLYILGAWRSGTTLLDRLLGQVKGFFSTGEIKVIWDRVFGHVWGLGEYSGEDVLCGCGIPFKSCPFWTGVFRQAFGGMEYVDSRRMFELSASLFRVRRIPQLLCPSISRGFRDDLQYFSQVVTKLYRATQEVSGCRVLIDSSKTNKYCVGLSRIPDIDLHVVHIVRDSRAVAYSWQRKKKRPEIHWTTAFQRQSDVWASAGNWLGTQIQSLALRPYFRQYVWLRYEDLVSDPAGTVSRLCEAIGEPNPALDFLEGQQAYLAPGHTVAGNGMRFDEGVVRIKPDLEWVEKLSKRQKAVVTAITWPLLLYYGYFRRGGKRGDRGSVSLAK